jgi:hypothetical protein
VSEGGGEGSGSEGRRYSAPLCRPLCLKRRIKRQRDPISTLTGPSIDFVPEPFLFGNSTKKVVALCLTLSAGPSHSLRIDGFI